MNINLEKPQGSGHYTMNRVGHQRILVFLLLSLSTVTTLHAQSLNEATDLSTHGLYIYPLGWSSEGRWGCLIATDSTVQLLFMDAVTDEILYKTSPILLSGDPSTSLDDFWKKNRSYIVQIMENYKLEFSTDFDIKHGIFTLETIQYTFSLNPPTPVDVPYVLSIQTSDGGIKTIYQSPSKQPVHKAEILGVLISPYEKRALAVLIEQPVSSTTWRYRFSGAHLSQGFAYKNQSMENDVAREEKSPSAMAEDLLSAIFNGQTYLVKNRLDGGADPNIKDTRGYSALLIAARLGHWQILLQLLQAGANPNSADDLGRSPLHYASFANNKQVVQALLAAGAKSDPIDKAGRTAKELAVDPDIRNLLR